jgi:hypothetical protein
VLKLPPSPSLSALKARKAYFTVTIMKRDHNIKDSTPIKLAFVGASENVDEYTYNGDVPISP